MNKTSSSKDWEQTTEKCSQKKPGNVWNYCMLSICLILLTAGSLRPADLTATPAGNTLDDILGKARQSVALFWQQFESVSCIESLTQEKLGKGGSSEYQQKSTYDYLVLLNKPEDEPSIEESRVQQGKVNKPKNIPLMLTDGLPTLLLVFHPFYEPDFLYQLDGEEVTGGHKLVRVGFSHIQGKQSTTVLRLRDRVYPLSLQGIAWIDPETGAIEKIEAGLSAPMKEINLKSLRMDVSYSPQKFSSEENAYWLPLVATVNIQSERQQWRNIHQFSKYRKFSVKSEEFVLR
jgi:hypothetical protein